MDQPTLTIVQIAIGVLAGNLFTAWFVYSAMMYHRREKEGLEHQKDAGIFLWGMIAPLVLAGLGLYVFS